MPRTLPTDDGWMPSRLYSGDFITVVEIVKHQDDATWDTVNNTYLKDRRAFWSSEDEGGVLVASLNTVEKWVWTDQLLDWEPISQKAGNIRTLGGIGSTTNWGFTLKSEHLQGMLDGSGDAGSGYGPTLKIESFDNRYARVGLMARNPAGTLSYPSSVVWLYAGRITNIFKPTDKWVFSVEDDRLQQSVEVPRTEWRNDSSIFEGFRAENTLHGRLKPWLFGHVPVTEGFTVVLGYEDTSDLAGRRVEFFTMDEPWMVKGNVEGLTWGHESLVDAVDTKGYLEINQGAGGWVATRSPYSKTSLQNSYFFADFNEEWLYLKADFVFTYADAKRDTGAQYANVTNPSNVVDINPDTYAETAQISEHVQRDIAYSSIALPWPNFNGLDFVIEGTDSDNWRDRDSQPTPEPTDYGFYVFWKFDTDGPKLAANGAYVFVNIASWDGVSSYGMASGNGPARFEEGSDGLVDTYYSGDREIYPMDHRDNDSDGTANVTGVDLQLSNYAVRQGIGKYIIFGVAAPFGEGGGSPAGVAGVRLYNIGIRVWGRIKFPDFGFFAEAWGYSSTGTGKLWAHGQAINVSFTSPLGVLGLFFEKVLPGDGIDADAFLHQDNLMRDGGTLEVGRQIVNKTDAIDEVKQLCRDAHLLVLGSSNLSSNVIADAGTEGVRVNALPLSAQPVFTFHDQQTKYLDQQDGSGNEILVENRAAFSGDCGIVPGSAKPYESKIQDVFTRFIYKFRWNPLRDDYDGVITISPTEWDLGEFVTSTTYLDQTTHQALLAASELQHRRIPEESTLIVEAPWVHDADSVDYNLAFLINNNGRRRKGIRFQTGFIPFHVRVGDPVGAFIFNVHLDWFLYPVGVSTDLPSYVVVTRKTDTRKGRIDWDLVQYWPNVKLATQPFW